MIKQICVFGDSIAYGRTDLEEGGWVTRLKKALLNDSKDYTAVYNLGIPGDYILQATNRIGSEVAYRKPGAVIFTLGVNDTPHDSSRGIPTTSLQDFESAYIQAIKAAKMYTSNICILSIINVPESNPSRYENSSIKKYNEVLRRLTQEQGIEYLDIYGLLDPMEDFTEDGIHPNSRGHKKIFEKVLPVAKRLVENNTQ